MVLGFNHQRRGLFFVEGFHLRIDGIRGFVWLLSFSSSEGGLQLGILQRSILRGILVWVNGSCVKWIILVIRWGIGKWWRIIKMTVGRSMWIGWWSVGYLGFFLNHGRG